MINLGISQRFLPLLDIAMDGTVRTLRVLLADDHADMLKIIAEIVSTKFQVVGTAENGRRALELAGVLFPDIILLDISMPVMNGFEAASCLKKAGSFAKVIFVTAHEEPGFVEAALSAGGRGYVLKRCLVTDLTLSIAKAAEGGIFVSKSIH